MHPCPPGPLPRTREGERLRIVYESTDGFEIARHDLRIRGPGELLGARQSGLPMLRFADLALTDVYGDYELGPLTNESERMIVIARRTTG